MASPLILARTFKDAHAYAQDELGLSIGFYRVVTSAGTIKAVRGVDIHLVPGWDKRPDRFTMKSALKWCRLNIIDVEKVRESQAAFDAMTPAPAADERYPLDDHTLEVAFRYNGILRTAEMDASVEGLLDLPTEEPQSGLTEEGDRDNEIEVIGRPTAPVPTVIGPAAEDLANKAPKRRRRSKCKECGALHFKDEPCPESESA